MKKNRIYYHCTAGFGNVQSIERFWREDLKWKHKGYAGIIELDGTRWYLHDNSAVNGYKKEYTEKAFGFTTNGIKGFNATGIHFATIGGVELVNGVYVAKDTRTPEQIVSLHEITQEAIHYLISQGVDVGKNFGVYGHRECSPDQNGDGVISKWERIKECPSWDVIGSYFHALYSSKDRLGKLPYIP